MLESYEESKERARKAKLQALAPGWNEGMGGVMQPVRTGTMKVTNQQNEEKQKEEEGQDELLQSSPVEMGEQTMDKMQRDQMKDWLDKWDGGATGKDSGGDLI